MKLALELSLVVHVHSVLKTLSLKSVVSDLLLNMALGIVQQTLSLSLCAPFLVPKWPSGPGVPIEPAWSIRVVCVAVDISLVLELR